MPTFSNLDSLFLDTRAFDISQEDIEAICRFFSIGKLHHYEKEKGLSVSHSNFFVYVETSRGKHALKFYPSNSTKALAIEYALNRFLLSHDFLTPRMHLGRGKKHFLAVNGKLATCFNFIDGKPLWQNINRAGIIPKVNATLFSLKNTLAKAPTPVVYLKKENFTKTVNALLQKSKKLKPYTHKELIDASLRNICKTYQDHRQYFTRQWMHNNTTLTNFLVCRNTIYTLDLSHIQEDYFLVDLASLIVSCIFFHVPKRTIRTITRDYFRRHALGLQYLPVLDSLVRLQLIKEYLTTIGREHSLPGVTCPTALKKTYLFHLRARKRLISVFLKPKAQNYLA